MSNPHAASASTMPVGFVGHGAPTVALDAAKGAPWQAWGARLPAASAVLVVSAHWESAPVALGASQALPLIYDFGGFPEALYQVQYKAPVASREVFARVAALLNNPVVNESQGWDHGVWTPLVHLFPLANVPVMQVSLPSALGPRGVYALGQQLAPLRRDGVFLLGSGNITHNLRRRGPEGGRPEAFAAEFDEWVKQQVASGQSDALLDAEHKAPAFRMNHPTAEHWLPLLFAAGASEGSPAAFVLEGFEYTNLSRRAVQWG